MHSAWMTLAACAGQYLAGCGRNLLHELGRACMRSLLYLALAGNLLLLCLIAFSWSLYHVFLFYGQVTPIGAAAMIGGIWLVALGVTMWRIRQQWCRIRTPLSERSAAAKPQTKTDMSNELCILLAAFIQGLQQGETPRTCYPHPMPDEAMDASSPAAAARATPNPPPHG